MTEPDPNPYVPHNLRPPRSSPAPQDRRSWGSGSYDTGDSSAGDRRLLSSPDTTFLTTETSNPPFSSLDPDPDGRSDSSRDGSAGRRPTSAGKDGLRSRRSQKPRSTGGFLLPGSLLGSSSTGASRSSRRREKQYHVDRKGKKPLQSQRPQAIVQEGRERFPEYGEPAQRNTPDDIPEGPSDTSVPSTIARPVVDQKQPVAYDADSAQIVNMALNLSESRKKAARRNVSTPLPPRLAPVPDQPAAGGSLKQHLQQQRRTSRTVSPGHRPATGHRLSLPPPREAEQNYKYHFTSSTLARAQKAKEQLELMAQYRRLLDIVPPLDPTNFAQQSTQSTPLPSGHGFNVDPLASASQRTLGRPYNPLQYIRNRKVRQRERHTISGQSCGFSDVNKVSDWVDDVAKLAATRSQYAPSVTSLPPFPDAETTEEDGTQSGPGKPNAMGAKPRRPRLDWAVDPADMIADVYWLEQGDHKRLVEDRNWKRIFPQDPALYGRPPSLQDDKAGLAADSVTTGSEDPKGLLVPEPKPIKSSTAPAASPDPEAPPPPHGARERARHKIQDLKGRHHKHASSLHGPDFLRLRRGSLDDSSDSGSDGRRKRARKGTITANTEGVLEKQMNELLAKEARERGDLDAFQPVSTEGNGQLLPPKQPPVTQEPGKKRTALIGGRGHNRKESRLTDISDADERENVKTGGFKFRSKTSSPLVSARQSLDLPRHARVNSLDLDSSLPNSPDLRPSRRGSGLIPPIGLDLSPASSRGGSPSRNPFTKVKQRIFRERSRDRSGEVKPDDPNAIEDTLDGADLPPEEIFRTSLDGRHSLDRTRPASPSPVRRLTGRATGDSQRAHSRIASLRLRDEIGGPRGIFKNPRIDAIIRGSVSKVGDLIWRGSKSSQGQGQQSNQDSDSDTSTDDEVDGEEARGRKKYSPYSPRRNGSSRRPLDVASPQAVKHYLDIMPPFTSAGGRGVTTPSEFGGEGGFAATPSVASGLSPPISPSQRRFDRLKPPRIDVQAVSSPSTPASPPSYPFPRPQKERADSDRSTAGSYIEGARRRSEQLNSILGVPPGPADLAALAKPKRLSMATIQSRPWSLCVNGSGDLVLPPHTQLREHDLISKREVARARTLMLSSAIKALEISRRAHLPTTLRDADRVHPLTPALAPGQARLQLKWSDVADLAPEDKRDLTVRPGVQQPQLFPLAAQVLSASISHSTNAFHRSANCFVQTAVPSLTARIAEIREKVNDDLSTRVRGLSDDADGLARDLVAGQRMKVKRVNDVMDKMLRRRRRRFRWIRRAGWLGVEWALVGFMWYVWLMVVLVRIVLGSVRAVWRGARWLVWL